MPRTVAVKLTAEASGYLATIGKATLATQRFASRSAVAIAKHEQAINKASHTAGLLGVGLLAGVAAVVKTTAQFDKAMSAVAATGDDARNNIDELRKTAIDMGAQTAFSAKEAAQGIETLLKAGVSAQDVMGGGLKGALDLAAAGNLEVGDAAEIAATAMTQFNLTGAQVPHIADLLAAGAGKAQGDVGDLGAALKQSGLVASQFGLSLEETTGTLAAFASQGLLGSDAGTSFKQMLLQLAAPSDKAANEMERLGIAAYDTQGNFIGTTALAGQLKDQLGKLTDEQRESSLAIIFGTDAIRAANALYDEGAEGIAKWVAQTNEAGYAAKVARERLNNLSGDLETLRGSIESAFIQSGGGANDVLRDMAQGANDAVNAIGRLPAPVLETGLKLTALTGIGLLAFAGLGKLATSGLATRNAFRELSAASPRTARGLATVGKAAGVATAAVVGAQLVLGSSEKFQFTANVDAAADALLKLGSTRVDLNNMFTMNKGVVDNINGFGDALDRVANPRIWDRLGNFVDTAAGTTASATNQMKKNFAAVDQAIASLSPEDAQRAFRDMAAQAATAGVPIEKLVALFPQYKDQVTQAAKATGRANLTTAELADMMANGLPPGAIASAQALAKTAIATGRTSSEAKQAKKQLKDLTEQMFSSAKAALELEGSEDGLEAAIDDATKAVKDNGRTLDKHTEKGRNNRASLRNLAEASIAYREKLIEQGASQAKVTRTTENARSEFIKTAIKMGATRKEAKELADKFGLLDKSIDNVDGQTVKIKFQADTKFIDSSGVKWSVNLSAPSSVGRKAGGGLIEGPGTGTSDSILGIDTSGVPTARVSNGEFVVNKKSTDRYRPLIEDINAGRLANGGYVDLDMDRHGLEPANGIPNAMRRQRDTYAREFGERIAKEMKGYLDPKYPGGGNLPSGGKATGRGMGAVFRYASALGMGHSTYPGHGEKGMNKAWDFTPIGGGRGNRLAGHAWANAPAYGIWYVIWNRRIASMTRRGAGWRPYTRYGNTSNPNQAHTNHVHISWYGQGTPNARRGLAVVGEDGPELVSMRGGERVRPVTDWRHATSGGSYPSVTGGGTSVVHHHHINVSVVMPNGGNSEAQAAALGRRIASDLAVKGV